MNISIRIIISLVGLVGVYFVQSTPYNDDSTDPYGTEQFIDTTSGIGLNEGICLKSAFENFFH